MSKSRFAVACTVIAVMAVLCATSADAYDRYKNNAGTGNCSTCHGDFDGGVSPQGTIFPGGDKHQMHRSNGSMNAECDLCHSSGDDDNPFIGSSDGTGNNPGIGCMGCHGRESDIGNDGISPGRGAGLRQHHTVSGINDCGNCHSDSDPGNYMPVAEDFVPFPEYYGDAADSNVDEPCNSPAMADNNENWSIGDFQGQDNDGDGLYDFFDPDCRRDGPVLSFEGSCPGVVNISIVGSPNAGVAVVRGDDPGIFTVPVGGCAGTRLDLAGAALITITNLPPNGQLNISPNLSPALCGKVVQTIDLATCGVGNVARIPG